MRLLLVLLLLLTPVLADDRLPLWTVKLPETWTADGPDPNDESLLMRLHPKDGRDCLVVIRRYRNKDGSSLQNELAQLRYGVVLKLEGKILSHQPWTVAGQPGLRVIYEGRASTGRFKKFVRYLTIYRGDLLTVHCVASPRPPLDFVDFQAIAEGINVSMPEPEAEPSEPQ